MPPKLIENSIISWWEERHYNKYWNFICFCGNVFLWQVSKINRWVVKSCWCLRNINSKKKNTIHWMSKNPLYNRRRDMIKRCQDINDISYKYYWWRWIKVCYDRQDIQNFCRDMQKDYKEWLQLDRIDNNWNYCKENCRWVMPRDNYLNKTNTLFYNWKPLIDVCKEKWINYNTVKTRIYRGRSMVDALFFTKKNDIK